MVVDNGLGLYDMSGNVWELTFAPYGDGRQYRGRSWSNNASILQVGHVSGGFSRDTSRVLGLRLARTHF